MVPVVVDGLVAGLEDDIDLVDGVELVVDDGLAEGTVVEADLSNRPNDEPKNECDAKTGPIRVRNGSF